MLPVEGHAAAGTSAKVPAIGRHSRQEASRLVCIRTARACCLAGYYKHAAYLAGAVEALRTRFGSVMAPNLLSDFESGLETARAALSEEVFETEWSRGMSLRAVGQLRPC